MDNFIQITPCMHVPDLDRALAFFNDVLGFRTLVREGDYAYVHRETAGVRVMQLHGEEDAPRERRYAYVVDVRDVDALYAELKPKLDALPPGDVHGPIDTSYGMRELSVLAPDGNLFVFGQDVAPHPKA